MSNHTHRFVRGLVLAIAASALAAPFASVAPAAGVVEPTSATPRLVQDATRTTTEVGSRVPRSPAGERRKAAALRTASPPGGSTTVSYPGPSSPNRSSSGAVSSSVAVTPGIVLRRDGSQAVPFVADVGPEATAASDGFDWGDAGIGATAMLALAAIAAAGLAVGRRPRQPHRQAVPSRS